MTYDLRHKARAFRDLNEQGQLLLPNAWDAASARVFAQAGFAAIGTTSAGIAYSRGFRDGQNMDLQTSVREIGVIAEAVSIPVTADIEAGYGATPSDVAEAVAAVLDVGGVGINMEDNTHGGALFSISDQADRIAAARDEADRRDIPLTINARTDVFILGVGNNDQERIAQTIERGRTYLSAGADLVFVPLVVDPQSVRQLANAFDGRLSVMAMPGAPSASELFDTGARRVSIGQTAMLAALGRVAAIAREMQHEGTWSCIEETFFGFAEGEALFASEG